MNTAITNALATYVTTTALTDALAAYTDTTGLNHMPRCKRKHIASGSWDFDLRIDDLVYTRSYHSTIGWGYLNKSYYVELCGQQCKLL